VTQDDRGRIWAVREPTRKWERYTAAGRPIGKPFNTAGTGLGLHYNPVRNLPGFAGPADPQVSDDGKRLASWGILEELDHIDPFAIPPAPKYLVEGSVGLNVSLSSRDADIASRLPLNQLAWPSWLHDGTFTTDTHNALSKDEEITVGHLSGPPPAIPDRDPGPTRTARSPT
jgi:hypothetical protein